MPRQVTIKPSNHVFTVGEGETVLAAAVREGFTLPYGCRNGACGACKGKILEGGVDYGNPQPHVLADFEKKAGLALFCQAKPLTDLVIEAREISGVGQLEIRKLPCRVQEMRKVAPDVIVLRLKLPANERLQFLAGQYIDILMKDGKRRSYSMGNPPHADEFIELHVRKTQLLRNRERDALDACRVPRGVRILGIDSCIEALDRLERAHLEPAVRVHQLP